jgi:glycosyltransferase involved in cell wall biosynthesis
MSTISVIIPTYNRVSLLGRAIQSVLRQSLDDLQLLIIDDGSNDGTKEFVRALEDPRVDYIRHKTNQGASAARNTGLSRANGEFVAFLDSDDEWLETKLEKQLAAFAEGNDRLGVVYTTFRKIDWRYEPELPRWRGDIRAKILVNNFVGTASTPLIRSSCFAESGNFDETICGSEDWDLWIRLADAWEFEHIPENLVNYYPQPISLTSDREGALGAYRILFAKHDGRIQSLDRSNRAEHYFYRGRIYLAQRKLLVGARCLIRALATDPRVLPDMMRYLLIESSRKVLDRIRRKSRQGSDA